MSQKTDPHREPISRVLLRAYRAADRALVDGLHGAGHGGVGAAQWELVTHIGEDGSRAADLARALGMTKQAVAQTVKRLQGAGYLDRKPDPQDGRARMVHLTPRGRELCRVGETTSTTFEDRLRRKMGRTRVRALKETLDELVKVADEG